MCVCLHLHLSAFVSVPLVLLLSLLPVNVLTPDKYFISTFLVRAVTIRCALEKLLSPIIEKSFIKKKKSGFLV